MKMKNTKRNYNKEPIVIKNNFTSLIFGITFWLMFNGLIIYLIFFGDVINWQQDRDWIMILKDEMSKSTRFGGVVVGVIVTNVLAFFSLYKNLKNPRKIILTNKYIKKDKSFNDLEYINLQDILYIKKSFFPLLGTGKVKKNYFGIMIGAIFTLSVFISGWLIRFIVWILNFIFLKMQPFYSKTPYITIFSNNTNRVLNIHILLKKDYMKLRNYFFNTLNINIDKAQVNFKLINTQGEDNVR
jgi:hypothetical protein